MPTKKSSRYALDERLDRVEEMLAAGAPSGTIEKKLAADYGISRRQVRNYIQRVYIRREKERATDAPYRRENIIRKVERFFATCVSKGKYGPAVQALVLEAKMSGAFDHSADREALLEKLGPPPTDPSEMLVYTRRVLVASLYEAMASPHLDIEKRQRIVSDIAFKISATQSRTEVEAELGRIEALVHDRRALPAAAEVVDAKSVARPVTSRSRGNARGPRPVRETPTVEGPAPDDDNPGVPR